MQSWGNSVLACLASNKGYDAPNPSTSGTWSCAVGGRSGGQVEAGYHQTCDGESFFLSRGVVVCAATDTTVYVCPSQLL